MRVGAISFSYNYHGQSSVNITVIRQNIVRKTCTMIEYFELDDNDDMDLLFVDALPSIVVRLKSLMLPGLPEPQNKYRYW